VKKPVGPASVLIVDEDLGFVGWLGDLFFEAGYQALPALSSRHAISLVKRFKLSVDVVAVNESLPGVRGLIGMLRRPRRPLKIVVIRDPLRPEPARIPAHATLERPDKWKPVSRSVWLKKILGVLRQAEAKAAG